MSPGTIARSRRSTITPSNRSISFDDKGLKGTFRLRDLLAGPPKMVFAAGSSARGGRVSKEEWQGRDGALGTAQLDRFRVLIQDGVSLGIGSYGCQGIGYGHRAVYHPG